jgi:hypothetical protein
LETVLIRIEGSDLPGTSCGPGPDRPEGHHHVHVAVQGRKGQQDLFGMVPADVTSAVWELEGQVASTSPTVDLRGPQIQGPPGKRFIYLTWGVVDADVFTMFRRAKLWLDAVPVEVLEAALASGLLIGRLGLSDDHGRPLCAAVRPPRIEWTAGATRADIGVEPSHR